MPNPILYLYGTAGCHLCEIAESLVLPAATLRGMRVVKIDIADHEQLLSQLGTSIPVLASVQLEQANPGDAAVLFWPFDDRAVATYLGQFRDNA